MKVNNYDFIADNLYSEGVLQSKGYFDGECMDEAYKALGIEGVLEGEEWCDLMVDGKGNEYAVAGTSSSDCSGDFYFLLVKEAPDTVTDWRGETQLRSECYQVEDENGNEVYVLVDEIRPLIGAVATWNADPVYIEDEWQAFGLLDSMGSEVVYYPGSEDFELGVSRLKAALNGYKCKCVHYTYTEKWGWCTYVLEEDTYIE